MKLFSVLISFLIPFAALAQQRDVILGTHTSEVGKNAGVIFSIQPDGKNFEKLRSFTYNKDGENSYASVFPASNRLIYGTTSGGGEYGGGTIYSVDGGDNFQIRRSFKFEEGTPSTNVIEVSNERLIGVAYEKDYPNSDFVYRVRFDGTQYEKLATSSVDYNVNHLFKIPGGIIGITPRHLVSLGSEGTGFSVILNAATLSPTPGFLGTDVQYADGYLYGIISRNTEALYRIKPDGSSFEILYNFPENWQPDGRLVVMDGKIYGTLHQALVFSFDIATSSFQQIYTTLFRHNNGLNRTPDGKLILITSPADDDQEYSSIIKFDTDGGNPTTIATFRSGEIISGMNIVETPNGYYGTTGIGLKGIGMIFRFGANGGYHLIKEFTNPAGAEPQGDLIPTDDGYVYGQTQIGGTEGRGVIFRMLNDGSNYKVIKSLEEGTSGNGLSLQQHGPMLGTDGFLYGTLQRGGSDRSGAIYKLSRDGSQYTEIYEFPFGTHELREPGSQLSELDGKLFGVCNDETGKQVMFSINTNGTDFTALYTFTNAVFAKRLMHGDNGKFYGGCYGNMAFNPSYFFSIDPDGTNFTQIHQIPADRYWGSWGARLLYHSNGKLYGQQGKGDLVEVFSMDPDGSNYSVVYTIGEQQRLNPIGSLTEGPDGLLYGRCFRAVLTSRPWIFYKIKPDGTGYEKIFEDDSGLYNQSLSDLVFAKAPKLEPQITYTGPTSVAKGDAIILTITTASSGAITWNAEGLTGSATITGDFLTGVTEGTVKLKISVAADDYYNAAMTDVVIRVKAAATSASKPVIWSATKSGGAYNAGTLFSLNSDGTGFSTNHDFSIDAGGSQPGGTKFTDVGGILYGVTTNGGSYNRGAIFSLDPATNEYTSEYSFKLNEGSDAKGGLLAHSDGKLYGVTAGGGANNFGTLFSFDPVTKAFATKVDFEVAKGTNPRCDLVETSDGTMFGLTASGTVFKFNPASNTFAVVNKLTPTFVSPNGGLCLASDGMIYATTPGGRDFIGTLVRIDPASGDFTNVRKFDPPTLGPPSFGALVQVDGKLYGTIMTLSGSNGGIFSFDLSTSQVVMRHIFSLQDGVNPIAGMTMASNGKLYGTTNSGGKSGLGTLFAFDPSNDTFEKLADFETSAGHYCTISLAARGNDKVYGLFTQGGVENAGTIFSFDLTSQALRKIREFSGRTYGANPIGNLAINNKTIYGGASGGPWDRGVIFQYQTNTGNYETLTGFPESIEQTKQIEVEVDGSSLFGVYSSLTNNSTVLYNFDTESGTLTTDHKFTIFNQGLGPVGRLAKAATGNYYGVTSGGGTNYGVIYETNHTTGEYTVKYTFKNDITDGGVPSGLIIRDEMLYGTTEVGGTNNIGIVYSYNIGTNTFTKLADFSTDVGGRPLDAMVNGPNGKLYGLTQDGVSASQGVLFEFDPADNTLTKKYQFTVATGLPATTGELVFGEGGRIFGGLRPTSDAHGGVFEFNINTNEYKKIIDFDGQNGSDPYGSFAIIKGDQTINFPPQQSRTLGQADFDLNATATSGLPVTYSAPSDRLTFSGALTKALKAGRVEVTASQDGDHLYNAAEPKSESFCINPAKPVITLSEFAPGIPLLTSSNDPGNQWYVDGGEVLLATGQHFSPTITGVYTVKSKVDDCESELSDGFSFTKPTEPDPNDPDDITGLEDPLSFISVFPNPADNAVEVIVADPDDQSITISLLDLPGRITEQRATRTNTVERFDIQSLAKGFYIFKVTNNGVAVTKKFVKK